MRLGEYKCTPDHFEVTRHREQCSRREEWAASHAVVGPVRVQAVGADPAAGADLVTWLQELGYDALRPVHDVASALLVMQREQPHVAIVNIGVDGTDNGFDVARLLRAGVHDAQLVFLAPLSDRETIDRVLQLSPAAYLALPFTKYDLYAAVEIALRGRLHLRRAPAVVRHGARLRKVLSFIEDRLECELTLEDLAREAGLSRDYFGRLFRHSLGLTPQRYLVQRRMAAARRRLEMSDQPIVEIALELGYKGQNYFTTVFKNECGLTPAAYRRRHRR